ncbi:hypothetical protein FXN63_09735 [Pigmentiphaga aceris]|uniref:Uncharacterized protein n=1 Tax=Pigmentiphaga aceris TaxID=1940612 RepID=A0A5C0AXE7_9BURK|nr:hypothetical protein [Pigmentiphaga aceris]QEI06083.1 hypothetical protein FXN63_09735 [Pigmentiphaga aceris]
MAIPKGCLNANQQVLCLLEQAGKRLKNARTALHVSATFAGVVFAVFCPDLAQQPSGISN